MNLSKGSPMNKIYMLILFLISACATAQSQHEFRSDKKTHVLESQIENLIKKSGLQKSTLGIVVNQLHNGVATQVYENQEKRLMNPASLTKILTAGASLHYFNMDKKFMTQILSDGERQGDTLRGSIYLKGGGDPSFTSESMWVIVNHFTRTGIKKIVGDIVVDDRLFDLLRYDPSRNPERVPRAYDAPVGAMSFNWNSINVYVRPGEQKNQPAFVYIDPKSDYIELDSKVTTGAPGSGKSIRVLRTAKGIGKNLVQVRGQIASDHEEAVIFRSITEPDYWSGEQLKSFLSQRGIVVSGEVRTGATPSGSLVLAELESKPISLILTDMMKFSNNYVAEMLAKNMSVARGVVPGNLVAGVQAIGEYLNSIGLKHGEDYHIINPSGLTRNNRISASGLSRLLLAMKKDFRVYPEHLAAMPIGGVDGTLKKRFISDQTRGWIRAKTGLLNDVVGLAGFAGNHDGGTFSFALIYNGAMKGRDQAKVLFDQIVERLVVSSDPG